MISDMFMNYNSLNKLSHKKSFLGTTPYSSEHIIIHFFNLYICRMNSCCIESSNSIFKGVGSFWRFTSWPVYYLHTISINHQFHSHAQCQTASSVAGSGARDKGQVGPRRRHLHPPPSFFTERCDDRQTSSAEWIWWAIINTERNRGLRIQSRIKQFTTK